MNDKAIEFETTFYKVNKILDRLEKAGLSISKYRDLAQKIKTECDEDISYDMNKYLGSAESFATSFLENSYQKAIKRLELLYLDLIKYDAYLKIASFMGVLKNFLSSDNKKISELEDLREDLLKALNDLKKSNTLNYQVEGELVEEIYNLAYFFIKEEIRMLGTSPTLETLKIDDIHKYNLDREIVRELETLDLKDEKFVNLLKQKHEIDMAGINATYLDIDFILAIINLTISDEEYKNSITNLVVKADKYYNELNKLNNEINSNKSYIEDEKINIKREIKRIYKNLVLFITSSSLALGLIAASRQIAKEVTKEEKYKITTTIYTKDSKTSESEYKLSIKNSLYLYEYEPYTQRFIDGFKRTVTKYDLSKIEGLTFEEYVSLEMDALGIKGSEQIENKDTLTLSDLYDETYYVLERITTDESDYIIEQNEVDYILALIAFLIIALIIDFLFECIFDKINLNERGKAWGFIDSIRDIKEKINNINYSKEYVEDKNNEIQELYEKAKKLFFENKDIFLQMKKLIPIVENNPSFEQEVKYMENSLKLTRKLEEEITLR